MPNVPYLISEDFRSPADTDDDVLRKAVLAATSQQALLLISPRQYILRNQLLVRVSNGQNLRIQGLDGHTLVPSPSTNSEARGICVEAVDSNDSCIDISNLQIEIANSAPIDGGQEPIEDSGSHNMHHADDEGTAGFFSALRIVGARTLLRNVRACGSSQTGIQLVKCESGIVTECKCSRNQHAGISLTECCDITIVNCICEDNGLFQDGLPKSRREEGYGITCATSLSGATSNRNITITGNTVLRSARKGIDVHSGSDIVITANHVMWFGWMGIASVGENMRKQVSNLVIANNIVDGGPRWAQGTGISVGVKITDSDMGPPGAVTIVGNIVRSIKSPTPEDDCKLDVAGIKVYQDIGRDEHGRFLISPDSAKPIEAVAISGNCISHLRAGAPENSCWGIGVRGAKDSAGARFRILKASCFGNVIHGSHIETPCVMQDVEQAEVRNVPQ